MNSSTYSVALLVLTLLAHTFAQNLPHSCADIYKEDLTRTSGVFTIYNRQGEGYQVFCDLQKGYGYTYVSPAVNVVVNIQDLYNVNNNTHVLVRDLRQDNVQYVAKLEQLPQFAGIPLSIQFNAHDKYNGLVNGGMTPYIYVGFLEATSIHRGEVHGYRVNGRDITYTNCDDNGNSYFSVLFNHNHLSVTDYSSDSTLIHQWVDLATQLPPHQYIPNSYFSQFETHFGGCGGYATSHVIPQVTGAAVGIRYDIQCSVPNGIDHGTISYTGVTVGSTVTYSCAVGYTMFTGDDTRTCGLTGQWTGTAPTCGKFPCDSHPCQNGGLCFEATGNEYICECTPDFNGQFCQDRVNA